MKIFLFITLYIHVCLSLRPILTSRQWNIKTCEKKVCFNSQNTVEDLPNTEQQYDYLHESEYPGDDYKHILGFGDINHQKSRLQEITSMRIQEVIKNKTPIDTQGCGLDRSFYISDDDYYDEISEFDAIYGMPQNLFDKINAKYPDMTIAAEFKRASPSKGIINLKVDIVEQCLLYAKLGATIISILTEFIHFKGTLNDMKKVRLSTQQVKGESERPIILRKDFILDRYQILEARANGADTILLIVAILGRGQLKDLITFARSMSMEPLVEVHTDVEMEIALACGAKVIGVNNRNLHTFQLDLRTTERLLKVVEREGYQWKPPFLPCNSDDRLAMKQVSIAALSGITSSHDIEEFKRLGVNCCLIGETLMKSDNLEATLSQLLGGGEKLASETEVKSRLLVKICGMTELHAVKKALQCGVNLIGFIFVSKSRRVVTVDQAKTMMDDILSYGERNTAMDLQSEVMKIKEKALTLFQDDVMQRSHYWYMNTMEFLNQVTLRKPLSVGVFQDQTIEEVNAIVKAVGLDLVQLHGNESKEYISKINVPCIKVLHVPAEPTDEDLDQLFHQILQYSSYAVGILLDTKLTGDRTSGGSGKLFDWSLVTQRLQNIPIIVAGGLNVENVKKVKDFQSIVGVDVSSGIEISGNPGVKDLQLIETFLQNARNRE